jgi:hypothetical protein
MTMRDFFVRRREVWQLTWRARLLLLALLVGLATVLMRGAGGFLAVSEPVQGRYLVVEGWMPAFAYQYAADAYRRGHYERVIAVGALPDFALSNGTPREFAAVGSLVAAGIPREVFEKALGPGVRVGVHAAPDPRFDLAHWWRSSEGVRSVLGETIAYVYARLFFDPRDLG